MKVQLLLFFSVFFSPTLGMNSNSSQPNKSPKISWATYQIQNKCHRDEQQDAFVSFYDEGKCNGLFGIFDGHGGKQVANYLKEKSLPWFYNSQGPSQYKLYGLLYVAEQEVLQNKKWDKVGTTAVMVNIDTKTNTVCFVNVGDSRAILEKNGQVFFATSDHKPTRQDELSRILEKGGKVEEEYVYKDQRDGSHLAMTRSIGDKDCKANKKGIFTGVIIASPELKSLEITPENKFIVLASDGILDDISSKKLVKKITSWYGAQDHSHKDLSYKLRISGLLDLEKDNAVEMSSDENSYLSLYIKNLCRKALMKGSEDNISLTIIELDWGRVAQ